MIGESPILALIQDGAFLCLIFFTLLFTQKKLVIVGKERYNRHVQKGS